MEFPLCVAVIFVLMPMLIYPHFATKRARETQAVNMLVFNDHTRYFPIDFGKNSGVRKWVDMVQGVGVDGGQNLQQIIFTASVWRVYASWV